MPNALSRVSRSHLQDELKIDNESLRKKIRRLSYKHPRFGYRGRFRDECLNMEAFDSLLEAQFVIASWREHYNSERPHSALAYLTPVEFIEQWQKQQDELRKIA